MYLEDYLDNMPDLESAEELDSSVYDWLAATPASTTVSTDMEADDNMLGLSMGTPLRFFEPDHIELACQVLAITDWAVEYHKLHTHPVPEILESWSHRTLVPGKPKGSSLHGHL